MMAILKEFPRSFDAADEGVIRPSLSFLYVRSFAGSFIEEISLIFYYFFFYMLLQPIL